MPPARMMRGKSSRSSRLRVSIGEPQSRSSRAPASRSVSACAIASSSSTPPCGPSPTWQCASTNPGRIQPPSNIVSAPLIGSRLIRPSTIHSSMGSSSGSPIPRTCCGTTYPGISTWTDRNQPARAAIRPDPGACWTGQGIRPASQRRADRGPSAASARAFCPSCPCLLRSFGSPTFDPTRVCPCC